MRKFLVIIAALLAAGTGVSAQDNNLFDHLGVSVGVGSTGITLDLSTHVTDYVGIRAGVDIMPKFKYATDIDIDDSNRYQLAYDTWRQWYMLNNPTSTPPELRVPDEVDVEGKLNNTTGHLLVDVFPFGSKLALHFTVGAYMGPKDVVNVYTPNDEQLADIAKYNAWQTDPNLIIGAQLGDYFLQPDANGHIDANVRVKGFRPYVGLGWGRSVPKKRVGFSFDAGVQFWGKPEIYLQDEKMTESNFNGEDGGVVKTLTKIQIYPCVTFRLTGRIF